MYGTRSSAYWASQPGKFDVLNLRMTFPSTSPHDIPDLRPSDFVPANLAAWNMPRHREYAAISGGALHFFLDDYRFETVWSSPERLLPRVQAVGAALTPDFSVWREMPRVAQVWNTYRSRWCGAYWQSQGIEVIPTVGWGRPDTYEFCFDGLPVGGNVAISCLTLRSKQEDRELFTRGVQELVWRTQPKTLLVYGRLRFCDEIDLPEVREYPTFWDRRRKLVEAAWASAEGAEAVPEQDEAAAPERAVAVPQLPEAVDLEAVEAAERAKAPQAPQPVA
ncbi:nuclease [Mycobacterium phage Benvolio]|uniref:Uncharacterized protein n=1 Tax=Mycobacterium phage Benvolio TaxID=2591074 RepID=A0A514A3H1_9CAUD|nr:nuclease [Mycobacterium phage Benvolio]QDH47820.1 hypothetical protein SEA_BENVOLIO_2 [Mycobacterium phage Benvolio]